MSRPMSIQILTALVLILGMTPSSMVAAESPYLLLRFTGSLMDNGRVQRRYASFTEMKRTNMCGIVFWQQGGPNYGATNEAAIEALLIDALEKETTRDAYGQRQRAKTEITFYAPGDSILLVYGFIPTNAMLVTDFAGWKVVSAGRTEIEKSVSIPQLLEGKRQAALEAYFKWNGLTNSAALRKGMKLEDAINILGPPTQHFRLGKSIEGAPPYPYKGELRWCHTPRQVAGAPYVELWTENGIVERLQANQWAFD
jgi:hypothetical protein